MVIGILVCLFILCVAFSYVLLLMLVSSVKWLLLVRLCVEIFLLWCLSYVCGSCVFGYVVVW